MLISSKASIVAIAGVALMGASFANLGGSAAYIGRVADDQLGEIFVHDMRSLGVDVEFAEANLLARTGRKPVVIVVTDLQKCGLAQRRTRYEADILLLEIVNFCAAPPGLEQHGDEERADVASVAGDQYAHRQTQVFQGAAPQGTRFALYDAEGTPVPCQTKVLARWKDESARWLLLDFKFSSRSRFS